uniref:Uncharacterized protein n=1 Tax=Nelumbo nucifera TaxID=4432 RepID=A0A822YHM8_NELNU|nr:TPA_asm: hypothetical protein HUJ06_030436 [Nelumbo nucifera]
MLQLHSWRLQVLNLQPCLKPHKVLRYESTTNKSCTSGYETQSGVNMSVLLPDVPTTDLFAPQWVL